MQNKSRTILVSFWTSTTISGLKPDTRLMAIGLISFADRNGVGIANPGTLKSQLFRKNTKEARIIEMLQELAKADYVYLFEKGFDCYYYIKKFTKYQDTTNDTSHTYLTDEEMEELKHQVAPPRRFATAYMDQENRPVTTPKKTPTEILNLEQYVPEWVKENKELHELVLVYLEMRKTTIKDKVDNTPRSMNILFNRLRRDRDTGTNYTDSERITAVELAISCKHRSFYPKPLYQNHKDDNQQILIMDI